MDHSRPLGHNLPQMLQTGKNSPCCIQSVWFTLLEPQTVREVCTLASAHSAEEYSDPLSQISWSYLNVTKKQ